MLLNFDDFQKQDIKFDISKLRKACDEVLKIKGFDTSLGIPHFAGISLLIKYLETLNQFKEIILEVFFGQNQIHQEKKLLETLKLMKVNIQNL